MRIVSSSVMAVVLALCFSGSALLALTGDRPPSGIAPGVVLAVAAIALLALASSAVALHDAAATTVPTDDKLRQARIGYRIARWSAVAVPVAGLTAGVLTWRAYGNLGYLGIAVWTVGIVLLVLLLLLLRHGRDMRRVEASRVPRP
jgi:hypothetical protein